jgi:hypothetical protein
MSVDVSGAQWFKSTYSGASQDCVEVAHLQGGVVGVRDSKNPAGAALAFAPKQWDDFIRALSRGEH